MQRSERAALELEAIEGAIAAELGVIQSIDLCAWATPEGALFVGIELRRELRAWLSADAVAAAVGDALGQRAGEPALFVVLFAEGALARSAEGAPDRQRCFERWRGGEAQTLAEYENGERRRPSRAPQTEAVGEDSVLERVRRIWQEVLGPRAADPDQSFFALGGSSLAAAQIAARVEEALAVRVNPATLFVTPTLRALAEHVTERLGAATELAAPPIVPASRERTLPLSSAQRQLWFLWQLEPESAAYNLAAGLRIRGPLHVAALERAFAALLRRHESLRTGFGARDGEPHQIIVAEPAWAISVVDLAQQRQPELEARARWGRDIETPFDLGSAPLLRVSLFRLAAEHQLLALTLHHIICDGWSMGILADELLELYAAEIDGRAPALPALAVQYADYALWQRERLGSAEVEQQLAHWLRELEGDPPELGLPTRSPRPRSPSARARCHRFRLSPELSEALRELGRRQQVSLSMLLLAAFDVLLYRYTGQSDLWVGVPTANRSAVASEGLIGFFVDTQVLRVRLDGAPTFAELLQRVKRAALGARSNGEVPFERVVEALNPRRSLAHNPLFQVKFTMQVPGHDSWARAGVVLQRYEPPVVSAHFDVGLDFTDSEAGIEACFTFALDRFEAETIERLGAHLRELLLQLVAAPERCIEHYELLSSAERASLRTASEGGRGYDATGAEPDAIERMAQLGQNQGERLALVCEDERWTYAELHAAASRIAAALVERGVAPDEHVAVWAERSPRAVAALLGVMYAGAAYVPIDPAWPASRREQVQAASGARWLLTSAEAERRAIADGPAGAASGRLSIDELSSDQARAGLTRPRRAHAEQAAYVIYTSGSTGVPKGVVVTRGALSAYVNGVLERLALPPDASLGMVSTLAADLGHTSLYGALCSGRALHLISSARAADADRFAAYMSQHGVGALKIVPSHLSGLLHASRPADVLPRHVLVLGGEASHWSFVDSLLGQRPDLRIVNHYGPTETTVGVLTGEVAAERAGQTVPMGRPLEHARSYVLDSGLKLCPAGVPGELYLGGQGLARAYHAAAGLTAERFVPDPVGRLPGARLYRTGDRARYLPGGAIEFLGRVDRQLKIRGYRVELSEIAQAIKGLPGVRDAVVVARPVAGEPSRLRLVAYHVSEPATHAGELARALELRLPDYMWPSAYVRLEQLPVTANGKLDARALPEPAAPVSAMALAKPQGEAQARLAAIWAEVLGLPAVGVHDNFFEMGGDSILSLKIIARAKKAGIAITPKQLFERQTIAALCTDATPDAAAAAGDPIERVSRAKPLLASHAQRRLWVLWQLSPESPAYDVVRALRLSGALDDSALQRAVDALFARHETLRTTFRSAGGELWQQLAPPAPVAVDRVDLTGHPEHERLAAARHRALDDGSRGFDLERGPVARVSLYRIDDDEHVLCFAVHHIAADGWSTRLLLDDFARSYAAEASGRAAELPALPIQYADYAAWQRQWLTAERRAALLEHWIGRIGREHPVLDLPLDRPRPLVASQRSGRVSVEVDAALLTVLRGAARQAGATLAGLLLTAFQLLLQRYTGAEDVCVGVVTANRRWPETHEVVGFFVNLLVLRTRIDAGSRFDELLLHVKQALQDASAHEDLPFEQLVEALRPERSSSHHPLFQVAFNHRAYAASVESRAGGLRLSPLDWQDPPSQVDLTLYAEEADARLTLTFAYGAELFDRETIEALARHYLGLLRAAVARPASRARLLPLLDAGERLAASGQPTPAPFPALCLHELLAERARRAPDRVAVTSQGMSWTQGELHARANRLARKLRTLGVGPEVLVGVCVERSLEMLVALLAILKAGGAYVPLDPEYPRARLEHMLRDGRLGLLLTQERWLERLPRELTPTWCLDRDAAELDGLSDADVPNLAHPLNVAYCMYTSGSTGKPKAVAVTHENIVNFLTSMASAPGLSQDDVMLGLTSLSFDIAALELYLPLWVGARVVVVDRDTARDPRRLLETLRSERVSVMQATPATWHAVCRELAPEQRWPCRALCGGEALTPDLAGRLRQHFDEVWNLYGPTETTVWSSAHPLSVRAPEPLLGEPIANTSIVILSSELELVPNGASGELFIGGTGVARGYHGRPALTAERFVPDPFALVPGRRMYRTGDRARRQRSGALSFLGRGDHQVKIRGHRVEPGEIEARLAAHPDVQRAVVVARDGVSGQQLVAYVVPQAWPACDALPRRLREHLLDDLPQHMVPAVIMALVELPLTPNGKLDRRELPEPEAALREHVPPRNAVEQGLAQIWRAVLKLERVGAFDNFFELGGDSIVTLEVVHRARELGWSIQPRDLFQHQTLAALAEAIGSAHGAALTDALEAVPLTPHQGWLLETRRASAWTASEARPFAGGEAVDAGRLEAASRQIVRAHPALRWRSRPAGEGAQQWRAAWAEVEAALEHGPLVWSRSVDDDAGEQRELDAARRSLDAERGPRLRALRLERGGQVRVVLVGHSLLLDEESWQVLGDELRAELDGSAQERASAAARSGPSRAERLEALRLGAALDAELAFWDEQLAGDLGQSLLARDLPAAATAPAGSVLELSHGRAADALTAAARAYRCSEAELALTALSRAWCAVSESDSLVVSLTRPVGGGAAPVRARPAIGPFSAAFPLCLRPGPRAVEVAAAIRRVKEQARRVPNEGLGFGLSRYAADGQVVRWAELPEPVISFDGPGSPPRAPEAGVRGVRVALQREGSGLGSRFHFEAARVDAARLRRLALAFQRELEGILERARHADGGALTPSDVVGVALDQQALDALLDEFS